MAGHVRGGVSVRWTWSSSRVSITSPARATGPIARPWYLPRMEW